MGFAEQLVEDANGNPRRRYAITDKGREALRVWLASDTSMPRLQNEPVLRALFADQGELAELTRTLQALRVHVAERRRTGIQQMSSYLDGDGLFQERAHIVTITADLVSRFLNVLDEWASEVVALSATWTTTADIGLTPRIHMMLEDIVADQRKRDERATTDGL